MFIVHVVVYDYRFIEGEPRRHSSVVFLSRSAVANSENSSPANLEDNSHSGEWGSMAKTIKTVRHRVTVLRCKN